MQRSETQLVGVVAEDPPLPQIVYFTPNGLPEDGSPSSSALPISSGSSASTGAGSDPPRPGSPGGRLHFVKFETSQLDQARLLAAVPDAGSDCTHERHDVPAGTRLYREQEAACAGGRQGSEHRGHDAGELQMGGGKVGRRVLPAAVWAALDRHADPTTACLLRPTRPRPLAAAPSSFRSALRSAWDLSWRRRMRWTA